jgi:hypothetical protein
LIAAAIPLCASVYVRPISYFLPIAVAAGLVVCAIGNSELRLRRLGHVAVFACVCTALVGVWQVRNDRSAGYGGFSSISDYNLYYFQAASVLSRQSGKSFEETQCSLGYVEQEVLFQQHPELRADRAAMYSFMRREGSRIVSQAKLQYGMIYLRGLAMLLANPGSSDFLRLINQYPESMNFRGAMVDLGLLGSVQRVWRESPSVAVWSTLLGLVNAGYFVLALLGLLNSVRPFTWPLALLLATSLYFLLLSGGPTGLPRLRHPLMPTVCMLGACVLAKQGRRDEAVTDTARHDTPLLLCDANHK